MPYKETQKQKEANRLASKRRRDKVKGMTPAGYDAQGMTGAKAITHGTKTIYVTAEKAAKLLMVCHALDRQISGLQGKENLLNMVRYGVSGPTMAGVKESLGG